MKPVFAKPKDNKIRKVKTPTAKKMRQELDLLIKKYCQDRDLDRCTRCGSGERLQAAHVLSKGRHPRSRFNDYNILTLCVGCHLFFAHKDPMGFAAWFNEKYPGRYERLLIADRNSPKLDLKLLLSFWRAGAND